MGSAFARPPSAATPPGVEINTTPTFPDELGPLLGQIAALRDAEPIDELTRAMLADAVSRALTGQVSAKPR